MVRPSSSPSPSSDLIDNVHHNNIYLGCLEGIVAANHDCKVGVPVELVSVELVSVHLP